MPTTDISHEPRWAQEGGEKPRFITCIYNKYVALYKRCTCLAKGSGDEQTNYTVHTDTDVRERGALQQVWFEIWLLLCKFHLRQCWTNKRKGLKLVPTQDSNFWKDFIYGELLALEEGLIASTNFIEANRLIADQRSNLSALFEQGSDAEQMAKLALSYLDYLTNTWMPEPLW
ncbi:hypothetical protein R3P38DRAFT_3212987 [Favolaschia claudopus]|uniref:Uncharacterized protein n=1 Tax=Favolaschia claudopus TaxID=2862362 RepID=A0AAW0AE30_9AGAR